MTQTLEQKKNLSRAQMELMGCEDWEIEEEMKRLEDEWARKPMTVGEFNRRLQAAVGDIKIISGRLPNEKADGTMTSEIRFFPQPKQKDSLADDSSRKK